MMGEDQVRQATVKVDGRAITELALETFAGGHNPRWRMAGLIGPSGERQQTSARMTISLPWTCRPEGGDTRELGVLFSAPLRFTRTASGVANAVVGRPSLAFDESRVERRLVDGGVGHVIRDWGVATAQVDPSRAVQVCAEVAVDTPLEGLQCSINGYSSRPMVTPISPTLKRAAWHAPLDVVRAGGANVSVLFLQTADAPAEVIILSAYCRPELLSGIEGTDDEEVKPNEPTFIGFSEDYAPAPKFQSIPANGLVLFGGGAAQPYLHDGWSHDEPNHIWMVGLRASIGINISSMLHFPMVRLSLKILTLKEIETRGGRLSVFLNERSVGDLQLSSKRKDYVIHFDSALLSATGDALIRFSAEVCVRPTGDARELAACFSEMNFRGSMVELND